MKALIFLFALAFMGCCKNIPQPDPSLSSKQSTTQRGIPNYPVNGKHLVGSPLYDTMGFEVYSCGFDSVLTFMWNTITIKVSSTGDSILTPCGNDYAHSYKGYALDTISNRRIASTEDSAYIKIAVLNVGDTVKYYLTGQSPNPMIGIVYIHAATFITTATHTFIRTWENPQFSPYGLSGVHISNNSTPFVNTIYIP